MCIQNKRKSVKHTSATRQTLDQVQVNETEIGNNQDYSSLTDDRADGSTYATLNVSEAPYLTPVSSHNIQYNGNIWINWKQKYEKNGRKCVMVF